MRKRIFKHTVYKMESKKKLNLTKKPERNRQKA